MYPSIVEILECLITRDESSWIIGELIADGWLQLNVVEVGSTIEWDYERQGLVCILGRPSDISRRDDFGQLCRPIIRSGRKSLKCIPSTTCSVPSCQKQAVFEVIFYDYYAGMNQVHFETDYTCSFICEEHMQENEAMARGKRQPRSSISYPFSKQNGGQAYTKYLPALFADI